MTKITDLPALPNAAPGDQLLVHRGGSEYKMDVDNLNFGVRMFNCVASSVTENEYSAPIIPALTEITTSDLFVIQFSETNTSSVLLTISGTDQTSLKKVVNGSAVALVPGEIKAGKKYLIMYNGADYVVLDPDNTIFQHRQRFTAGQLAAMGPGAPFTLVAAPGSGIIAVPVDAEFMLHIIGGGAKWSKGGVNNHLVIQNAGADEAYMLYLDATIYEGTSDAYYRFSRVTGAKPILPNAAIQAYFFNAAPTGGGHEMSINLHYRLLVL